MEHLQLVRRPISNRLYSLAKMSERLAEGMGFEPTIRYNPYNGLANRRLQPLGHPSTGVVLTRRMHGPF
jgi:hypothetical protein